MNDKLEKLIRKFHKVANLKDVPVRALRKHLIKQVIQYEGCLNKSSILLLKEQLKQQIKAAKKKEGQE